MFFSQPLVESHCQRVLHCISQTLKTIDLHIKGKTQRTSGLFILIAKLSFSSLTMYIICVMIYVKLNIS